MSITKRITRKRRRKLLSSDAMHVINIERIRAEEDGKVFYCAEFKLHDDTNPSSPLNAKGKDYFCDCIGDRNLAGIYQGAIEAYKWTLKNITERMGGTLVHMWTKHIRKNRRRVPEYHVSCTIRNTVPGSPVGATMLFAKAPNFIDAYRNLWNQIINKQSEMAEERKKYNVTPHEGLSGNPELK